MLRAAKSLPNLRQQSSQSTRAFASQALFNDRSTATYRNFTVPQLKTELKSRGLTLAGRKADLVSRLQEADEHGLRSLASHPDGKRFASAKASASEASKGQTQARPAFMPTGQQSVDKQQSALNVDFPETPSEELFDFATPPISPFNTSHESHATSGTSQAPQGLSASANIGRVSTASMPSTMGGGGPVSPQGDLTASEEHVTDPTVGQGSENLGLGNFKRTNGGTQQFTSQKASQLSSSIGKWEESTLRNLEETSGIKIAPLRSSLQGAARADTYAFEDRPLNDKERSGAWKLGGTVAAGWLLAGLFKPSEKKQQQQQQEH